MKLFLGSLPFDVTENELKELCGEFGEVVDAKLILDQYSGRSKGFAFVEMATRSEGHRVMETLNKREYKNKVLVCNEAKPKGKKKSHRR